ARRLGRSRLRPHRGSSSSRRSFRFSSDLFDRRNTSMLMRRARRVLGVLGVVWLMATPAFAHHEAMFGPQSSAVLSPGIFLSALVFDKETGKGDGERRETTTVYSVGFKPVKKQPVSMAFVIPVTYASGAADPNQPHANRWGFEDMLISARYRVETP